jgi:hypothetical protein
MIDERSERTGLDAISPPTGIRPGQVCKQLLAALDASDGRRRRRKRNTTPDAIGMAIKRDLLERAARDDPDPDAFDDWLLAQCLQAGWPSGPVRAMALEVQADWQIARAFADVRSWLDAGAPSDDAQEG